MKLSIITINYNNLEGLKKTVDSVLSQTWRDFEWIIVDGGSTDGSKEYIESLAQSLSEGTTMDIVQWHVERFSLPGFTAEDLKTQKIESSLDQSSNLSSSINNRQSSIANSPQRFLWCSEPDKGVYNAMNKGITMAKGEYLDFMNSGDCFYNADVLYKVFGVIRSADILYGYSMHMIDNAGHLYEPHYPVDLYALYKSNLCHQSIFFKTNVQKKHLYDESLQITSDYALLMNLAISGHLFEFLDIIVCRYDCNGISSLKNVDLINKEHNQITSTQIPYFFKETLDRLDFYKTNRTIIRLEYVLKNHKYLSLLVKGILYVLDKLFMRINYHNYKVDL